MVKFDSFSISESILRALNDMGFEEASPIQAATVPLVLDGHDLIGQAQTGTGKTAAFGIPAIMAADSGRVTLILVPTRELAQQVTSEIERIGKHAGVRPLALYGGTPMGPQVRAIQKGGHRVLVATPGRLRDHIERGILDPTQVAMVVLDEADEMLKMGFVEEVEFVLDAVGGEPQILLFSATMPEPIVRLAERYLKNPEHVHVTGANASVAAENTEQFAVKVRHAEKIDAFLRILAVERPTGTLVFRHTRETVDELVNELRARSVAAVALHGGLQQNARDAVLAQFRSGRVKVLVATNVAARGLDVDTLSHVVNFDTPRETDAYVHRIGRTGRAGRDGRSFLFVTPSDMGKLRQIERVLGNRLQWLPVPTDEDVALAADENLSRWLDEQAAKEDGIERYLAVVEKAVANGKPLHTLAAAALRAAARHEGLEPPRLETRRDKRQATPANARAPSDAPKVAISVSVGRDDGVRPGDLVGALTNGAGLVGAEIGRIDILPRMSVIEIPSDRVEEIEANLAEATIRNRQVRMRVADNWEFRGPAGRGPPTARANRTERREERFDRVDAPPRHAPPRGGDGQKRFAARRQKPAWAK